MLVVSTIEPLVAQIQLLKFQCMKEFTNTAHSTPTLADFLHADVAGEKEVKYQLCTYVSLLCSTDFFLFFSDL